MTFSGKLRQNHLKTFACGAKKTPLSALAGPGVAMSSPSGSDTTPACVASCNRSGCAADT
eukprot:5373602-Prymnesium_polylepis.2